MGLPLALHHRKEPSYRSRWHASYQTQRSCTGHRALWSPSSHIGSVKVSPPPTNIDMSVAQRLGDRFFFTNCSIVVTRDRQQSCMTDIVSKKNITFCILEYYGFTKMPKVSLRILHWISNVKLVPVQDRVRSFRPAADKSDNMSTLGIVALH